MRKVAILTSGGDAPGMNTCLFNIVNNLKDFEVVGILDGFKGILDRRFIKLDSSNMSNIECTGGTILGSVRYPEFSKVSIREKARDILKEEHIDTVICIGGDGTSKGAEGLYKLGINTICIPSTIDNDVYFSDYAIGFYTACSNAVDAIEKIRTTMASHHRFCVVETMGRYCSDICVKVAKDSHADICIPDFNKKTLDQYLDDISELSKVKQTGIIVINEHLTDVFRMSQRMEECCGVSARSVVLGYIQRGGKPVTKDMKLASDFAIKASDMVNKYQSGLIGIRNKSVIVTEFK